MGQHLGKEEARLEQVQAERRHTGELMNKLHELAKAEKAADTPAAPGSYQAQYGAVFKTLNQLYDEERDLDDCIRARREGRTLPMPARTPLFVIRDPSAAALEPGTPVGGASLQRGQGGGGSSSKKGAPAGGAEGSEDEPLLAAEPERLARGLRRRQGHGEGS